MRVFALWFWLWSMTTAACLIEQRQAFYLTTMVVWFGLPLGIQFFYGADIIWRHRRVSIPAILIPTVYLCALDRMAIGAGVWNIDDATSVGLEVFGLPIEEIFFTLTNVLVVQGVLLYVHVRQHGWRAHRDVSAGRAARWFAQLGPRLRSPARGQSRPSMEASLGIGTTFRSR